MDWAFQKWQDLGLSSSPNPKLVHWFRAGEAILSVWFFKSVQRILRSSQDWKLWAIWQIFISRDTDRWSPLLKIIHSFYVANSGCLPAKLRLSYVVQELLAHQQQPGAISRTSIAHIWKWRISHPHLSVAAGVRDGNFGYGRAEREPLFPLGPAGSRGLPYIG